MLKITSCVYILLALSLTGCIHPYVKKVILWNHLSFNRYRESEPLRWIDKEKREPDFNEVYVAPLGHATVLMRIGHIWLITDPLLYSRTPPNILGVNIGPGRLTSLPIDRDQLPVIDIVLLSHNHYDHFCVASLDYLAARNRNLKIVVPPRMKALLKDYQTHSIGGFDEREVSQYTYSNITIHAFEVEHHGPGTNGYEIIWSNADKRRFVVVFIGDSA